MRFLSVEPMLGPVNLRHIPVPKFTPTSTPFPGYDGPTTYNALAGAECAMDGTVVCRGPGLDWIICGGESGRKARPMHPDWARSLRDQCVEAGVSFYFKQWGAWTADHVSAGRLFSAGGPLAEHFDDGTKDGILWATVVSSTDGKRVGERVPYILVDGYSRRLYKVGKAEAGRELDGRTWDEYP